MPTTPAVPEKQHAELGASVASRWMNCPGSIQLARQFPAQESSVFAEEGTAAHAVAELCLQRDVDPAKFVGMTVEGVEVTEDMADAIRVYTDECNNIADWIDAPENGEVWIERKFSLEALNPPSPMFGTADFVAYDRRRKTLWVRDLKFGQGVVVEAKGNPQLKYYALGALLSLPAGTQVDDIDMGIVQPRALHPDGAVRSEVIVYEDLLAFSVELLEAAEVTQRPDAPLSAGKWCKFCPARGACPEQARTALAIAQDEFSVVEPGVIPSPAALSNEVIADYLEKLPILEQWAAALRANAQERLSRGEEIPGYKMVAKRATRKWGDETVAEARLKQLGLQEEELYEMKLKSPAQVEKRFGGKKKFENAVGDLVTKQSSGYSMVAAHDPRPAVLLSAADEFLAITSGEEQ